MKRRRQGARIVRTSKNSRKVAYRAYMNSPKWRKFRAAWLNAYDAQYKQRCCYVCGVAQSDWPRSFDLHHRTYERLGSESYEDLVLVCSGRGGCHPKITRAWRGRGRTGLTLSLWQLTDHYRNLALAAKPRVIPKPTALPVRRGVTRGVGRIAS